MSQAGLATSNGLPTPTTFVTDSGNAIPVGNILNVVTPGGGTDGISTSGSGNTITVTLSGAIDGTGTTIGAVTADLITIPLGAVATTYTIEAKISGFESTTPAGCGYNLICVARTTGAAASIVGTQDKYVAEDAAIVACDGNFVASGNNIIVRVLGTVGLTVNWNSSSIKIKV